jgi:S-DNA-T family DNA segregation ATPase FtsK/SpoIIIE
MDHCDECGFVYSALSEAVIPGRLRDLGPAFQSRLGADPDVLRRRPSSDVWSALEYCCHARDVLVVQRERLALALREDVPEFVPMGREERVVTDRYNEQEPRVVSAELMAAAGALALDFEALDDAGWRRVGIYNWPERAERSMRWLGQHTVHEGEHHLADVDRALAAAVRALGD